MGESYETLATAGCTTTCLAMAYTYLEGTATTPDGMAERLYYTEDGYLGFPKAYEKYDQEDYLSTVLAKLKEGIPVLAGAKKRRRRAALGADRGLSGRRRRPAGRGFCHPRSHRPLALYPGGVFREIPDF